MKKFYLAFQHKQTTGKKNLIKCLSEDTDMSQRHLSGPVWAPLMTWNTGIINPKSV